MRLKVSKRNDTLVDFELNQVHTKKFTVSILSLDKYEQKKFF